MIYFISDLKAGYDTVPLAEESRNLTSFCAYLYGLMRLTSLPQGYTNSMQEFCCHTEHMIRELYPKIRVFDSLLTMSQEKDRQLFTMEKRLKGTLEFVVLLRRTYSFASYTYPIGESWCHCKRQQVYWRNPSLGIGWSNRNNYGRTYFTSCYVKIFEMARMPIGHRSPRLPRYRRSC